jgi:DNA helicase II / ATP-dependent DNA helicase PcrA
MALLPFEQLNPRQRDVVTGRNRVVRVTGGPGTGKTLTAAARYRYLVIHKNVNPRNILLLTFSRRQRDAFEADLLSTLPAATLDIWIETFHSCAHRLLQRYTHAVEGLSANFTRLNEFDQWLLMRETAGELQLHSFLEQSKGLDGFVETMLEMVRVFKQNLVEPQDLAETLLGKDSPDAVQDVVALYDAYTRRVVNGHYMDPGDLVKVAVEMLRDAEVRSTCHQQFQHIIVDEMQELDPAQFKLLESLHHDKQSLIAFGDPWQSVYQFRGATPETFGERFASLFPGSHDRHLEKSYRCPRALLQPLRQLLKVTERDNLIPQSSIPSDGPVIRVYQPVTAEREAEWIAGEIRRLTIDNPDVQFRDIAVILRSTGAFSDILHNALETCDIPHNIDPPAKLESIPAVRVLLASLDCVRLGASATSLGRLLQQGALGIPAERRWALMRALRADELSSLEEAIGLLIPSPALEAFLRVLFNSKAEQVELVALTQCLGALLIDVLQEQSSVISPEKDIRRFLQFVRQFFTVAERLGFSTDCAGLLSFIDQGIPDWALANTDTTGIEQNSVAIQTVQAAKGMEYRYVFIPQLTHDAFPAAFHHAAYPFSNMPAYIKECVDNRRDNAGNMYQPGRAETLASHLEEEQRLFYVAITRTSECVYCSCPATGSSGENLEPSIFLKRLLGIRNAGEITGSSSRSVQAISEREALQDVFPVDAMDALNAAANKDELAGAVRRLLHSGILGEKSSADVRRAITELTGELCNSDFLFAEDIHIRQTPTTFGLPRKHRLSASQLTCYASCPRKYYYQYIAGIKAPETVHMKVGQFEHAVLQKFHEGTASDEGALLTIFDALWEERQAEFGSGVARDSWRDYMWTCLANYRDQVAGQLGRPIALEQRHLLEGAQGLSIAGVVDRVDADNAGLEIIDYKKQGDSLEMALVSAINRRLDDKPKTTQIQLPIYAAMVAAEQGQQANRLTLLYLDFKKSRSPRKVTVELRNDDAAKKRRKWLHPSELAAAQQDIQQFAAGVFNNRCDFERGEHAECSDFFGKCDYRAICPLGRDD